MQHIDKFQHLTISLVATVALVLLLARLQSNTARASTTAHHHQWLRDWLCALRYPLAFSAVYSAGAIKEVGDGAGWWPGNLDLADLAADVAGCVLGLLAAAYMEARERSGLELPL